MLEDEDDVLSSIDESLMAIAESLQVLADAAQQESSAIEENAVIIAKIEAVNSIVNLLSKHATLSNKDSKAEEILKTCYEKINNLIKEI
jgi:hypothetical protein